MRYATKLMLRLMPAACLLAAVMAGPRSAWAQEESGKAPEAPVVELDEAEVERLVEQFQSKDPVQRQEAHRQLRDMGAAVLPHLHTLLNSTDPEIRREAEDLKRELQSPRDRENGSVVIPGQDEDMRRMIEELLRRFRENGGNPGDPFEDMRREMDEFEREMEALRRHIDEQRKAGAGSPFAGSFSYSTFVNGDRLTYERGGDGSVRVEIQNRGQDKPEVYAAESWEKFAAAYPEIVSRYGLSENGMIGFSIRIGATGARQEDATAAREESRASAVDPARLPPTGAKFSPVSDVVAAQLGLTEPAFAVDVLDAGVPAYDRLGLRRWDLITRIHGAPVTGDLSVEYALRELLAAQSGTVTVIRQGEPMELTYLK